MVKPPQQPMNSRKDGPLPSRMGPTGATRTQRRGWRHSSDESLAMDLLLALVLIFGWFLLGLRKPRPRRIGLVHLLALSRLLRFCRGLRRLVTIVMRTRLDTVSRLRGNCSPRRLVLSARIRRLGWRALLRPHRGRSRRGGFVFARARVCLRRS